MAVRTDAQKGRMAKTDLPGMPCQYNQANAGDRIDQQKSMFL
jgi:hypothetical protein